jgi:hypothetical protein
MLNFSPVQAQPWLLAGAGTAIGATTITLQSFQDINGVLLTMADFGVKGYGTIEPGSSAQEEQITWSGVTQNLNGTATLTGVKTVLFKSPFTETAGLTKSHAGGVSLVYSNTAAFYNDLLAFNNDETVTGMWTFPDSEAARARITSDTDTAINTAFVTFGQLARQAIGGAAKATDTVYGLVKLSVAAASAAAPIAVGDNDTRVSPVSLATVTANEVAALAGTGTPNGTTGKYVTNDDTSAIATNNKVVRYGAGAMLKASTTAASVAGDVVVLDAANKLPAVDGSQLTNVSNFLFQGIGLPGTYKSYYNYSIPFMTTSGGNPTTAAMWSFGGGSATMQFYFCTFAAGGAGQTLSVIKTGAGTAINFGTKKIITEFSASLSGVGTNMVCWGIGETFTNAYNSAANKACFFVIDTAGNLYAKTSNGGGTTDHTETAIAGITLTTEHTYRIEYNPGVNALFYINGVLKATIVTTLPNASQAFIGFGTAISGTNYINAISAPQIAVEK